MSKKANTWTAENVAAIRRVSDAASKGDAVTVGKLPTCKMVDGALATMAERDARVAELEALEAQLTKERRAVDALIATLADVPHCHSAVEDVRKSREP